jgi:adenylate cyclase
MTAAASNQHLARREGLQRHACATRLRGAPGSRAGRILWQACATSQAVPRRRRAPTVMCGFRLPPVHAAILNHSSNDKREVLQSAPQWGETAAVKHDPELLTGATPEFERRVRAVLVADVVGYTRLMEAAEDETHARYRTLRVAVVDPLIVTHRGELVKNTGDGFVAVFESPLDAVHCAAELQQEIALQEARQAPERRITFRIGIHWDPVIVDLNDVYGRGVNIAVRLQSVAPAGGIVVSSGLLSQISNLREFKLDDLGEVRLKNLSRPVHAFAMMLPGVDRSAALAGPGKSTGWARLPSIAVLPFKNLSPNPEDSYFAEGFVEDIIVTLGNIPELLVVSRGSTLAFRRGIDDAGKVGEKLGVQYYLTGGVRRSGERIRLSVELIDVAAAAVMWAEKYDIGFQDVFSVQDEISTNIVGRIATYVRQTEIKRALRMPPQNLNAYDYTLRALDLLYRLDFANFSRARTLLENARDHDDTYAAPYAYSAHWHMINIAEGWSSEIDADAAEVIRLSNCALERDPANALALAVQGQAKAMFYRDYEGAVELVDRAVATSPSNSWAWVFSSGTYGITGDPQAGISRAERAIRLSPIDQHAFFNYCLLGQNHYLNGSFEDAIRWSRKSFNLNPRFGNSTRVLAASLVAVGRMEEANRIALHHKETLPRFRVSDYARRCPFKEPQASIYVERLKAAGLPA